MSKHTPGEWKHEFGEGLNNVRVITDNPDWYSRQICKVEFIQDLTMTEANARLIAAAPDLLDAAKIARGFLYSYVKKATFNYTDGMATIDAIETAITKAEGTP